MNAIINIVLLSLAAGMGTGVGALAAIIRRPGRRLFGFLMGMTAGVMISLSFLELVNEAWEMGGFVTATVGFGAGALFMFLLDALVPHIRFGEQETPAPEPLDSPEAPCQRRGRRFGFGRGEAGPPHRGRHRFGRLRHRGAPLDPALLKSGLLIAIGITIHNIPEGIAVGAGYMRAPQFGIFIALAILLHNIPEGIAVALPLCSGGFSRWDAFKTALFSGLVEPIGALAAALFLASFAEMIPGSLAFAGGVMVFITLDELIPTAREHGHQHFTGMGIIVGAIFVFLLSGTLGV